MIIYAEPINMLKRKIDSYLENWKNDKNHNPLIIYGARQIGKTTSVKVFSKLYQNFVEINFIEHPEYKQAFINFNVEDIIKRLSFMNPDFVFVPHETLILFDEIQEFMDATTALKFFKLNGKYDVICTGSALGINTSHISSVSVGYKDEYIMHQLDFEEFLWANGYDDNLTDYLLNSMLEAKPLDDVYLTKLKELYKDYMVLGGYPKIISKYLSNGKNFSSCLSLQKALYKDYLDDISKYLSGIDVARAKRVFISIPAQLAKDNHKFQFSKLAHGARFNEYYGVSQWLKDSGTVLIANNCKLALPLKGNEELDNYRMYYSDTGLLMAAMDDESQNDFRMNGNMNVYGGALFESSLAADLTKQGFELYFHRSKDSTLELDFITRHKNKILPLEIKAKTGRAKSIKSVISSLEYPISKGIKFMDCNIGYKDDILTLPWFLSFLLKRFLDKETFL